MTLEISPDMDMFPGTPPLNIMMWSTIHNHGYNSEMLFMSSHTGTHMDAPYHFVQDGLKIHQIPTERLHGHAILVDARVDGIIGTDDIKRHESAHGIIPDMAPVIFRTGWQSHLGHEDYFTNNPGLDEEAAKYLAAKRIPLIGTDAPSIDAGVNHAFPAHNILAGAGALNVEALANLENIRTHTLQFIILPMNIRDATGAPVRAVAIL